MARKNRKFVYMFILALVLLYIVIYTVPNVTGVLQRTEILESGSIQVKEKATCYFVRNEKVYAADSAGELTYLRKDGTLVRKGESLAKLKKKNVSEEDQKKKSPYEEIMGRLKKGTVRTDRFKAERSGVVSSMIDGYETYFTPEKMKKLKYEQVKDLHVEAVDVKRQETMAGEPVIKVSDDGNWYMVCWVEAGSVERYEAGRSVTIKLSGGDVKATVDSVTEDAGDRWKVVFQSNRYYEKFSESRMEEAEVVTKDESGLVVSNGSLTTREGQAGLMVRKKDGEYGFTPVQVIASDGEKSVLKGITFINGEGESVNTVNVYDEVLKNPKEIQE